MLKKHQVLLNDWLAEFVRYRSKKYDISFSEDIRLALCLYFTTVLSVQNPESKSEITLEKVAETLKKFEGSPESEEQRHKAISKIYFEARKSMENYISKEKEEEQSSPAAA